MQRVLVIDSERQFATALQAHLGRYQVEVELAEDGKTGIEAAKSNAPDLIVLAIELSDDNGFLVGRKLKRSKKLGHVPIIILSNDENADNLFEQHKKTKSKAEDYVRRPASVEDVAARMLDLIALKPLPATEIEIEGEAEMSDENESDEPS
ncbi:MAG: response regulator, partial [Myxococcales bacterium]|nr:response regulator [Myxococcales bacterium]